MPICNLEHKISCKNIRLQKSELEIKNIAWVIQNMVLNWHITVYIAFFFFTSHLISVRVCLSGQMLFPTLSVICLDLNEVVYCQLRAARNAAARWLTDWICPIIQNSDFCLGFTLTDSDGFRLNVTDSDEFSGVGNWPILKVKIWKYFCKHLVDFCGIVLYWYYKKV